MSDRAPTRTYQAPDPDRVAGLVRLVLRSERAHDPSRWDGREPRAPGLAPSQCAALRLGRPVQGIAAPWEARAVARALPRREARGARARAAWMAGTCARARVLDEARAGDDARQARAAERAARARDEARARAARDAAREAKRAARRAARLARAGHRAPAPHGLLGRGWLAPEPRPERERGALDRASRATRAVRVAIRARGAGESWCLAVVLAGLAPAWSLYIAGRAAHGAPRSSHGVRLLRCARATVHAPSAPVGAVTGDTTAGLAPVRRVTGPSDVRPMPARDRALA